MALFAKERSTATYRLRVIREPERLVGVEVGRSELGP
jgi:hypothetical protein